MDGFPRCVITPQPDLLAMDDDRANINGPTVGDGLPAEPHSIGENPITGVVRIGKIYPNLLTTEFAANAEDALSRPQDTLADSEVPPPQRAKERRHTVAPVELTEAQQQVLLQEQQKGGWLARFFRRLRS